MFTDRPARSFLDPGVLSRLGGFPFMSRQPMLGSVSGRHPSPHRGSSVEFAEYRKYVPGDDLRRLDWRAHGRSDKYFVKEFEADTNLRCCFVLDTSGSMDFGTTGITKIEYARKIIGTLGQMALQQGDAVGLSCMAKGLVRSIPPKRNPSHLMSVFDVLEAAKPQGESHIVPVLHELAETIRQRALVIVLSDLFVEPEELKGCFEHLRFRRHDLAVFHLLDPRELNFNFRRPMRFLDMEGGPAVFAEPNEIADRYHKALNVYLDALTKIVRESGVDYNRISIDENFEQVLIRFLVGRSRGMGGR